MTFFFTATGNSLYAARHFDEELVSIPQEMRKQNRHYKAEKIGIVCPLFEFDIPDLVKDFIRGSEFETDYFYIVVTFGCHSGAVAKRVEAFLDSIGKKADYINTVIMFDNAIIVFDMEQQASIDAEKKVDEHLAAIKADIDGRKQYIQPAEQFEVDFSNAFFDMRKKEGPMYAFPLYKVTEACIGCGTCTRVCPTGCVRIEEKRAVHDYTNCAHCMACIQACPTKAIQFATVKEPNPNARYRNPNVSLKDIIAANWQK